MLPPSPDTVTAWRPSLPVDDPSQTVEVLADGDGFRFEAGGEVVTIAMNQAELPVTLMQVGQQRDIIKEASHAMVHAAVLVRNGFGCFY